MLLQVWVRGRRKNTRARSLASPGFGRRARARDVRVNGPPKSGSNPCGRVASFCRSSKEPIGSLSGLGQKTRLLFGFGRTVTAVKTGSFTLIGFSVTGERAVGFL
jgi:hypothetical protein